MICMKKYFFILAALVFCLGIKSAHAANHNIYNEGSALSYVNLYTHVDGLPAVGTYYIQDLPIGVSNVCYVTFFGGGVSQAVSFAMIPVASGTYYFTSNTSTISALVFTNGACTAGINEGAGLTSSPPPLSSPYWSDGFTLSNPINPFFLYPWNAGTFQDFSNWSVAIDNESTSTVTGTLKVYYGLNGGFISAHDDATFTVDGLSDAPIIIPKSESLSFPNQSGSVAWDAYIEVSSAVLNASGSTMTFNINPGASLNQINPLTQLFSATTTNALCDYTSASFFADPAGNIQQGLCNVLYTVLLPNTVQQQDLSAKFNALYTPVSKKVPFGYIGLIQTAVSGISDSSTTASGTASFHFSFLGIGWLQDLYNTIDLALAAVVAGYGLVAAYKIIKGFNP